VIPAERFIYNIYGAVEEVFFYHKVHKGDTKDTKVKTYISLCDLCENTL
jgi:hypothetical protein